MGASWKSVERSKEKAGCAASGGTRGRKGARPAAPQRQARDSRLYALLLWLFLPRRLKTRYAAQAQHTFALLREEARAERGIAGVLAAWLREVRQLSSVRRAIASVGSSSPASSIVSPPASSASRERAVAASSSATGASAAVFGAGIGGGRPPRRGPVETSADVLRHAMRGLRRSPVLAVAVVVTFGLGIGANTAAFSVVNSVLLNPLPYDGADRLLRVWQYFPEMSGSMGFTYEQALQLQERSQTLERLEFAEARDGSLGADDEALPVRVGVASLGLFAALELPPRLGRVFAQADGDAGAAAVVMLGEATWRGRFGARRDVLGTVLTLDGAPRVVVGVVDASIRHLRADIDLWVPMVGADAPQPDDEPSILAWRRNGVSLERARVEMETIGFDDKPRFGRSFAQLVAPGEEVAGETRSLLYAALMAVSLVLLIACVNVAHLMLARGRARRVEIAIRTALGATRARIAGEQLVDSGLLTLAGGALGVLLAAWSIDLLTGLRPDSLRFVLDDVRIDRDVMAYAAIVSALSGALAGLAPVLDLRRMSPDQAMRGDGSAAVARGGGRIVRHGLLVAEVGLSAVLLIGAGLLIHSLVRLERADPGYDVEGLVGVGLRFDGDLFPDASPRAALYEEILETVGDAPTIDAAALASSAPVQDMLFGGRIEIDATGELSEPLRSSLTWVAPGYFNALGIPVLDGRDFSAADIDSADSVIIVNRTFAERYFPGASAVNQLFWRAGREGPAYRIVGVVDDAVQFDPLQREYDLQVYLPLWTTNVGAATFATLLLRVPPDALRSPLPLDMLEDRLAGLDAGIELGDSVSRVRDRLSATLDGPRFNVILFGAFAVIALAMALVGLYGVVSHTVAQRAREMGIRIAIGAHAADVRRLVLRQGLVPVVIGIVMGLAGAAAAGRAIAGFLYLVEPFDPPVFAIVPVLLMLVALAAIWVPALRATRVDPVTVLRAQ